MMHFNTIIDTDDQDNYFLTIPEEILTTLNWKEGDTLDWRITDSKQIIITKVKDSSSTEEKYQQTNDWYTVKEQELQDYYDSESEGKEYKEYKDYDEQYESYFFSPEAQGSWG